MTATYAKEQIERHPEPVRGIKKIGRPRSANYRPPRERKKPVTFTGLGATVRRLRIDAGLTQEKLGERARISHGYISRLEGGYIVPTVEYFYRIAAVLGTTIDRMIEESEGVA